MTLYGIALEQADKDNISACEKNDISKDVRTYKDYLQPIVNFCN